MPSPFPLHIHHGDEFSYLIEASIEGYLEQATTSMKAGETFHAPREKVHGGKVVGATPARLLAIHIVDKGKPLMGSNEEFFHAVEDLTAKLEAGGHVAAAAELRSGLRCLNGLTDGSALFLEAIERVHTSHAERFTQDERKALAAIRAAVDRAVYRR